ncbi:MAG: c-type cytochrome domain-containing protein [Planctomycetaceae bacterium]
MLHRSVLTTAVMVCAWWAATTPVSAQENAGKIEAAAVDLGRPVDFERDIYPILDKNCLACHNLAINESDLVLESVENILKGGASGAVVVPGNPDESLLFKVIARAEEPAMPPLPNKVEAKALTPQELGLVKLWIAEGAKAGAGTGAANLQWQKIPSNLKAIYSTALSPWGRFAASGRVNQIYMFDLLAGDKMTQLLDPNLATVVIDGQPLYPTGAAHRDFVHAMVFSPDGTMLATGDFKSVKLWQRGQNIQKWAYTGPAAVTMVAAAHPEYCAVALADNSIVLLKQADGTLHKALSGHTGAVKGLQFSLDGTQLYSASVDMTIRIWTLADGAAVLTSTTTAPINDLVLSKPVQPADAPAKLVTAHADNMIRVWNIPVDANPPVPLAELPGHGGPVNALVTLPTNGDIVISGSDDGTVRTWNLTNNTAVLNMNHGGPVTDVAARPDGKFIASSSANNVAKLWQADNGTQIAELIGNVDTQRQVVLTTERQTVLKQKVALADAGVKAADASVTEREAGVKMATEAKAAADKALADAQAAMVAADAALVAAKDAAGKDTANKDLEKAATDAQAEATKQADAVKAATTAQAGTVRALERAEQAVVASKEKQTSAKALFDAATAVATQSDADLMVVQQADAAAPKPLKTVAFVADGRIIATSGDDNLIHLWDSTTGKPLENLTGNQAPVAALAAAAGSTVVSGAANNVVIAWDADPTWQYAGILGPKADAPLDLAPSIFINRVLALAFSPDGKFLITGGGDPSRSGQLLLWDVATRTMVREFENAHSDTIFSVDFSHDGKQILSGAADKFVKIFDVETGAFIKAFEGHTHHVLGVSWRADGALIASAGADNAIKIWTVETGEQARTIATHSKQVTAIHFIGVGDNIVTSGGDTVVRMHTASNGGNYRNLSGNPDYVYATSASRNETLVIAGGEDGILRVWDGTNGNLLKSLEPPKPAEEAPMPNAAAAAQ